jgi:integrase/recombinase XerD
VRVPPQFTHFGRSHQRGLEVLIVRIFPGETHFDMPPVLGSLKVGKRSDCVIRPQVRTISGEEWPINLTAKDVLWQQRQLRFKGKGGPYGKKSKVRVVPMSHRVRALLEHYFALEKNFPVKTRRAQDIVKAVANRAKLTKEVSPHVLRHTFATMALQKGISLPTVQKILGHDRLQTTAIYLNFTDVHIQEEFERKW